MFTLITISESWGIFWSIKFGHFNVPLLLKINRHFGFTLCYYARVYGTLNLIHEVDA